MDLYRFYDRDDRLLYVGISLSAAKRASEHRAEKAWWSDVARMEVEHLDVSRSEAEAIEKEAIRSEAPLYNVTHAVGRSGGHVVEPGSVPAQVRIWGHLPLYVLTPDVR